LGAKRLLCVASLIIQGGASRRAGSDVELVKKSSKFDIDITDWEATMATLPKDAKYRDALPRDKDWKSKVSLVKILKDAVRFSRLLPFW